MFFLELLPVLRLLPEREEERLAPELLLDPEEERPALLPLRLDPEEERPALLPLRLDPEEGRLADDPLREPEERVALLPELRELEPRVAELPELRVLVLLALPELLGDEDPLLVEVSLLLLVRVDVPLLLVEVPLLLLVRVEVPLLLVERVEVPLLLLVRVVDRVVPVEDVPRFVDRTVVRVFPVSVVAPRVRVVPELERSELDRTTSREVVDVRVVERPVVRTPSEVRALDLRPDKAPRVATAFRVLRRADSAR